MIRTSQTFDLRCLFLQTLICKRKNLNDAYPASSLKRYQGIPVWSSRRRDNVEMKLVSNGTSNRLIQGTVLTGPITNLREVQKSIELGDEVSCGVSLMLCVNCF